MNEYDNLSDEEIDARLASIDGKLASFDASAGGEPVARPEAPFQDERPKSIDDMTDEEIDARLSQIDTQIGRSPQQPVTAAQRQLTREERIAQNNADIARAHSQEDQGVLDHIGEGIAEGLRGAGRAAKAIGKGFVGIASGAARLAGTPVRALTGWDGLHRLADSIDSGYDNWGADTLASEYGFDQGTNIGTVGEKIAGLSGTLGSLALGGGVANAAKLPMAVRAGGVALQKSLPWMFGNDAAVRTYDTAKQTAEANGEEFNRARALGLASVNGAIHYLGFKLFENQSLNRMLGMPQAAELAMPGFANSAREGGTKTFSGIVDGVRNGLIKHVVAERAKGALKAGGIMGVQNFLSSLPQQAAEGRDIDWYEALKAGAEGVEEGAFMEGLMGGAAILRSKAAARKFTADKYFREGYRASNGEHVPGLLHTKEGREFIMKQSPDEQARILDIVSHGGKVSKAELDAACLPPDMKPEELKEFAKDWRKDLADEWDLAAEPEALGDNEELEGNDDVIPREQQMRNRAKVNEARDLERRLAEAEEVQRIAADEQAADDAAVAAEEAKYSEANARADAERQVEADGAEQLAREEAYRRTEAPQEPAGARGETGAADVPSASPDAPQGAEAALDGAQAEPPPPEVVDRPNRLRRQQPNNFRHPGDNRLRPAVPDINRQPTRETNDETGNGADEAPAQPIAQVSGRDGRQPPPEAGAGPLEGAAARAEAPDAGVVAPQASVSERAASAVRANGAKTKRGENLRGYSYEDYGAPPDVTRPGEGGTGDQMGAELLRFARDNGGILKIPPKGTPDPLSDWIANFKDGGGRGDHIALFGMRPRKGTNDGITEDMPSPLKEYVEGMIERDGPEAVADWFLDTRRKYAEWAAGRRGAAREAREAAKVRAEEDAIYDYEGMSAARDGADAEWDGAIGEIEAGDPMFGATSEYVKPFSRENLRNAKQGDIIHFDHDAHSFALDAYDDAKGEVTLIDERDGVRRRFKVSKNGIREIGDGRRNEEVVDKDNAGDAGGGRRSAAGAPGEAAGGERGGGEGFALESATPEELKREERRRREKAEMKRRQEAPLETGRGEAGSGQTLLDLGGAEGEDLFSRTQRTETNRLKNAAGEDPLAARGQDARKEGSATAAPPAENKAPKRYRVNSQTFTEIEESQPFSDVNLPTAARMFAGASEKTIAGSIEIAKKQAKADGTAKLLYLPRSHTRRRVSFQIEDVGKSSPIDWGSGRLLNGETVPVLLVKPDGNVSFVKIAERHFDRVSGIAEQNGFEFGLEGYSREIGGKDFELVANRENGRAELSYTDGEDADGMPVRKRISTDKEDASAAIKDLMAKAEDVASQATSKNDASPSNSDVAALTAKAQALAKEYAALPDREKVSAKGRDLEQRIAEAWDAVDAAERAENAPVAAPKKTGTTTPPKAAKPAEDGKSASGATPAAPTPEMRRKAIAAMRILGADAGKDADALEAELRRMEERGQAASGPGRRRAEALRDLAAYKRALGTKEVSAEEIAEGRQRDAEQRIIEGEGDTLPSEDFYGRRQSRGNGDMPAKWTDAAKSPLERVAHVLRNVVTVGGKKLKVLFADRPADVGGQMRYMRNGDGEVVGEYDADRGEIRLYPGATVADVVHEFTHPLVDFARAEAKAGRGELLGKIKDIIDAERATWEQPVRDAYADKGEGEILEEIFTHAMGRKGEKLFGKSTTTLEGRRWYNRLWDAIKGLWQDFATKMGWNKADLRGIGDMSPEDTAQRILSEMAKGRSFGDVTRNAVRKEVSEAEDAAYMDAENADIRYSRRITPRNVPPAPTNQDIQDYLGGKDDFMRRLRRMFQDKNIVIRDVEERLGVTDKDASVYYAKDRAFGKNEHELTVLQKREVEPIVEKIHKSGGSLGLFSAYLYARHSGERNAALKASKGVENGSGMTKEQADTIFKAVDRLGLRAAFEDAARDVWAMNRKYLQRRVDSGRMTQADYDFYTQKYKHYVPLRTDMTDEELDIFNSTTGGWKRNELMAAQGRKSAADDPLAFSIVQNEQAIRASNANEVRRRFAGLVRRSKGALGEVVDGVNKGGAKWSFTFGDGETVETGSPMRLASERDDIVLFKENGQLKAVKVNPGEHGRGLDIARAVTDKDVAQFNRHLEWIPRATRWMSAMRTQYVPTFIVRNMKADNLEVMLNALSERGVKDGAKFFGKFLKNEVSVAKGVKEYFKTGKSSDRFVQEAVENGLLTGGGMSAEGFTETARRLSDTLQALRERPKILGGAFEAAKDTISLLNACAEYNTRMGVYKTLREEGMSVADAVSYARDVTVNFNRKGYLTPYTNAAFMFSNAAIQGMGRAFKSMNSEHGKEVLAGMFLVGVAQALLDDWLGHDDESEKSGGADSRNLTEYDKSHSLGVALPTGHRVKTGIRNPWALPMYAGRKAVELLKGVTSGEQAMKDLASEVGQFVTEPVGGNGFGSTSEFLQTLAPTIIDPFVQWGTGKDYRGQDRLKKSFDKYAPDSWNGKDSTPEAYKAVAKALNFISGGSEHRKGALDVAPENVRLLTETVFGGVLTDLNNLYKGGEHAVDAVRGKPAAQIARDIPFVRDTFTNMPDNTSRFYAALDAYNADKAEFKKTTELGRRRDMKREKPYLTQGKGRVDTLIERVKELRHLERGEVKAGQKWVERKTPVPEERKRRFREQRLATQARVLKMLGE